jgi:hyperosmotically inducible periplasmic protein
MRRKPAVALVLVFIISVVVAACGRTVGETIDDSTINTRVKTALLNDPDVGGLGINVSVFKGVVTLSGRVRSESEEARAVELARKISGVEDVKSALQVIP